MSYVRLKGPEGPEVAEGQDTDAAIKAHITSLAQKFSGIDKKDKGAIFSSVKTDPLAQGSSIVLCARISGTPTKDQKSFLANYKV